MSKNDYVLATRTYSIKGYRKRKRSMLGNMLILLGVIGVLGAITAAVIYFLL